jgi:hypothetical protein
MFARYKNRGKIIKGTYVSKKIINIVAI